MGRIEPKMVADELETITQYLDYQRATVLTKVSGVDSEEEPMLSVSNLPG